MSETANAENLTAWQRWEAPVFEEERLRVAALGLPTAAQIEEIQRQAHEEGFQAGHAEGMRSAQQENQRLAELITALQQQADEQVAQALLELALETSRQMLQQALKVQPELVLGVVRAAIGALPHFNQGPHLVLHPDDAELVRARMGEQLTQAGWKIFEDSRISRGGARIETASSQIDAAPETRWKHIVATLGQDTSWLQTE